MHGFTVLRKKTVIEQCIVYPHCVKNKTNPHMCGYLHTLTQQFVVFYPRFSSIHCVYVCVWGGNGHNMEKCGNKRTFLPFTPNSSRLFFFFK